MRNFLSSGGLGDAVMTLGKLRSPQLINESIHLLHAHLSGLLLKELDAFYTYQNIDHEIIKISSWSWIKENKSTYEKELFSTWHATEDGIEINPFPKIIHKQIETDIVLSPFAGQRRDRLLNIKEIEKFIGDIDSNRKITYIGSTGGKNIDALRDVIDHSNGIDLIDKTTLTEVIDIICSAKSVIAPEGFVVYMGGMAGRRVFSYNYNVVAIKERAHPSWNIGLFDNLNELRNKI